MDMDIFWKSGCLGLGLDYAWIPPWKVFLPSMAPEIAQLGNIDKAWDTRNGRGYFSKIWLSQIRLGLCLDSALKSVPPFDRSRNRSIGQYR